MSKFSSALKKINTLATSDGYAPRTSDMVAESTMADVISVVYDNEKTSIGEIAVMVKSQDGSTKADSAIPFNPFNFVTPVPNERVQLIKDPGTDQFYYTGILPPSVYRGDINYMLNSRSRTFKKGTNEVHTGNLFKPRPNAVRSVDVYEGDYVIQSRYGSSIRLAGTNRMIPNSFQRSNEDISTPIMIFRNGQLPTEDMDIDESSIYLTSNQHIDIPFKSPFPSELEATKVKYGKGQVILYSDRICIGSRTDDIVLNTANTIQLMTSNWSHNVDTVLDVMEELLTEVKGLGTVLKDMNLTSVTQTFVIPGIGTTALSTKVPDFNTYYAKAIGIEQRVGSLEQKLRLLKQN
tara:strand:- start:9666 stop:10715 length:1050 start_codon:yes stop_codon:yes gene_type:complete